MNRRQREKLERRCGRPSVRLVSFDVFDTLLTRPVVAPADLFTGVGRRASCRLGRRCEPGDPETFAALRVQAEQLARKAATTEETTLDAIWEILERLIGWDGLRLHSSCELDVEAESLTVVRDTADLVDECRRMGKRLAFVSDTYLPEAFVRKQLECHGMYRAEDGLYVSSARGKMKATGSLFDEMLGETGIPPRAALHIGDHPQSDGQMPRRLGIPCARISAAECSVDDWALYRRLESSREQASRIAGASRAGRVSRASIHDADATALVGELLGPATMVFVVWLVGEARRLGLERLYFSARDGYLPWRMAKQLAPLYGDIECKYLYVSRRALYLPSVFHVAPDEMPWLRKWFERNSLRQALAKLDVSVADFARASLTAHSLAAQPDAPLDDSGWQQLWAILQSDPVRQLILDNAAAQREAALAYFQEQGLLNGSKWAAVDIGWLLSCQTSLRKVLRSVDPHADVRGLYLGLRDERSPPADAGLAYAMCYGPGQPVPCHDRTGPLFGVATAWEHLFGCAPHGNVRRYIKTADGRNAEPECSAAGHPLADSVAALLDTYATTNMELARSLASAPLREILLGVLENAATSPSLASSRLAETWPSSRDEAGLQMNTLARPYGLAEAVMAACPSVFKKLGLKGAERDWPAASRRISSMPVRGIFAAASALRKVIRGDA